MKRLVYLGLTTLSFTFYSNAEESVCNVVLNESAFNKESYTQSTRILLDQYEHICTYQFDSLEEASNSARSSGLSGGYAGYSLGVNDARQTSNGKYSFSESSYCKEFKEKLSLDSETAFSTQSTDMALSVWNSCIRNVHSNQMYITYNLSHDGSNLTGTLFRSVGSIGGYGRVKGISVAPEQASVSCTIGTTQVTPNDQTFDYPLVANPTNFSCTKDPNQTVSVSLITDQGDPAWFQLPSVQDKEREDAITNLRLEINRLSEKLAGSEDERQKLQRLLEEKEIRLAEAFSARAITSELILRNAGSSHPFIVSATPSGNNVLVKFEVVAIGSDSCNLNIVETTDIIRCSRPINLNVNSSRHNFKAQGNVFLEKKTGTIKFNGTMLISDVAQVDFSNSVILSIY